MFTWCKKSFQISFRTLIMVVGVGSMVPALMAQNDPSEARVRGFNNQLLTVYGRLFSSPGAEAIALRGQFGRIIQQRQALLGQMIANNPTQALNFAFSEDVLGRMSAAFPESAAKLESQGAWEGEVEAIVFDRPDLSSHRTVYRMNVGSETYDIHFAKDEPVGLKCRDRLRVRGVRVGSRGSRRSLQSDRHAKQRRPSGDVPGRAGAEHQSSQYL